MRSETRSSTRCVLIATRPASEGDHGILPRVDHENSPPLGVSG